MKCVILAGGRGTRLSELTNKIPKPMVKINGKPIIVHIINHFKKFGIKDFIIAAGYKKEVIKRYFRNSSSKSYNVKVIDTGLHTMTGGRIKRLKKYLLKESFFMTYGDGLSTVNINKLYEFHKRHKKIASLTAVRPPARFGALKISSKKVVTYFKEKSALDEGWVNGGFFVLNPKIFKYIKNDQTFFEREPLQKVSKLKSLFAYKHKGFWQCMDTLRDKKILEKKLKEFKKNELQKL